MPTTKRSENSVVDCLVSYHAIREKKNYSLSYDLFRETSQTAIKLSLFFFFVDCHQSPLLNKSDIQVNTRLASSRTHLPIADVVCVIKVAI
jgi:hypothetical protein